MNTKTPVSGRIYSIDILRGAVMIIMALDHVRDYFHITAAVDSPTNLASTTPALFFTRWITHFCAPAFVLLAGVSAWLMGQKKTKSEMSSFLIKRGCWLVAVEIFIVTFAWTFNPFYNIVILQVIWAIGISMIMLGIFVRFATYRIILLVGLIIICCHNLLDYPEAALNGEVGLLWDFVHHGFFKPYPVFGHHVFLIVYAFLPWTGIMMLGYGVGKVFSREISAAFRKKILFGTGSALLLLFLILRFINTYGDPSAWSGQRSAVYTLLSFLNVTKYPPSLDYIGMTVGVSLIALGLLERAGEKSFKWLINFGRVPFFFYVLHLYMIHLLVVVFFILEKFPAKDIAPQRFPFLFRPDRFGLNLWIVDSIWIAIVLLLYPLCRWYTRYKGRHRNWWLSYL
jgi:uncharacterized membrane protein